MSGEDHQTLSADDGHKWITYHRHPEQPIWITRGLLHEAIDDL